ncbi:hypothetical protein ID866_7827 [Astraeus odoratus]|nr:hypothetical protein ID866_7827 [Astraeus odoratus]
MYVGTTAGRKRAMTDDSPAAEKRETRSSKVQKTEGGVKAASSRGAQTKGTARLKTGLTTTAFKARAPPLHVALSYNQFTGEGGEGDTAAAADTSNGEHAQAPILSTTTLAPSSFSTGSFGWKGSKRIVVALKGKDGEREENVHVMLTINATVIGSKDAKEGEEEAEATKEGGSGEGEGTHEPVKAAVQEEAAPAVGGSESAGAGEPVAAAEGASTTA